MNEIVQKYLMVILTIFIGTCLFFNFSIAENPTEQKGGVYYTCPMTEHADVVMDKPGKCPKCGMELVKKEVSATKYTCPMKEHSDVVMDKPGKCPKCGMELVPMKMEGK